MMRKVDVNPKESLLFNAFLVMFIIHATQTGVGIVGLPRIVYMAAKHDAWLSVLAGGILTGFVLAMIVLMLGKYESADLYGIQVDVFGKWIGNALNIFYMLFMTLAFFIILMNYIEIIQVWIFPDLPTWQISLVLILLTIYAVNGGVRIIVGVAFLSVLGTLWLNLFIIVPLQYSDFKHIFPIMTIDMRHFANGIYKTSLSLMGFELLMFYYPYVKDKKRVFLFSQLGNLFTTIVFTVITLVCITFFAENGLARTIWPVLSMFKIVKLPNLERFEFIAVSFWMLIILPNMCSYLWAASKGFQRVMNWKQRKGIWILALLVWTGTFFVRARYQMNEITDFVAKLGFLVTFCYPVVLSMIVLIKKWFQRRKETNAEVSS